MAYPRKTPAAQFHVDCTPAAKSRFAALHDAFGFKTKAATFEAVLFAVSIKDRIDPADSLCGSKPSSTGSSKTSTTYEGGNDFRAQDDLAEPPRSRISGRDFQPKSLRAPAARGRPEKRQSAQAVRRLRLEGNARPGSRGWIPAPSHLDQRGRHPHRAVATEQRGTQEAHFGGVVRAHSEISDLLKESRYSASTRLLDVARASRQAGRSRNQSRPRVAVHDEDDHGKVQRAVPSGGLDWLRLRDSPRHRQPSRPCRALPAHGQRRICRMQHRPESGVGTQGPDEISTLVLRAGEQTMGTGSRLAAKIGGAHFQTDRLRQDGVFSALESVPDGRLDGTRKRPRQSASNSSIPASGISKRPSRRSANVSFSSGVQTSSRGSWGGACRGP